MKLVINIPAYNEEEKIGQTISRIPKNIDGMDEIFIQVVDDGSKDRTTDVCRASNVDCLVSHGVNRGIGVTFRTAVEKALENGADIMVNIDADGQFDPEDISKLIGPILNFEADMVSADRFGEKRAKNMPASKYWLNRLAAWIIGKFMNMRINDLTCGFRAYNRETLLRLNLPGNFTYTQEVIIDALGKNLKVRWVPVVVTYFAERKSRVVRSIWGYVNNSARIILKAIRDVRPMKFFGIPGALMMILSVGFIIYFFFLYFQDFKISPYRNVLIFAITLFVVGLQFFVFALMADMIKTNRKLTEDQMYLFKKEKYKK
jgi:glycosyltransferase involved in cell wall biosynthesis